MAAPPFITLTLVDEDSGAPARFGLNAAFIQTIRRWRTDNPGSDYREGLANAVVKMTNGQEYFVRESLSQIQSQLAAL